MTRKAAAHKYTPNKIHLIRGGSAYFRLLSELIAKAQHSVHIQTYIFTADDTGDLIATHLTEAAARGVKVYLLVDGYATPELPAALASRFKDAGLNFGRFEPLFRSRQFYFGRRLHHKVAVIDGKYALAGGLNIADRYNDHPPLPAWLDFALYLEGATASDLEKLCCRVWNNTDRPKALPGPAYIPDFDPGTRLSNIRLRRNDWVNNKKEIWNSYQSMFRTATSDIVIMCSYFLPGLKYRKSMVAAIERGVKIRVVVAGLSDVPIAKYAERYLYSWLLKNQIELYEYQPSVLHAKMALRDGEWMTIGSFNVNNISAYASIELNIDVWDNIFVAQVQQQAEQIITDQCIRITKENFGKRNGIFRKLLYQAAYGIIKVLLFLGTFYFRQKE